MEYLILDVETTTFQKGNRHSQRNKLCLIGILTSTGEEHIYDIEYSEHGYADQLAEVQALIDNANTVVVFNGKFDLGWLCRFGIHRRTGSVFDVQLAEFILSGQTMTCPSLNEVAAKYGVEQKLDEVKQLWEQGIDTTDIPKEMLTTYLSQDLLVTEKCYFKQLQSISSLPQTMKRLLSLSNQDLLVLLEMEQNGLHINFANMEMESIKIDAELKQLIGKLDDYFRDVPDMLRNYNSGDCLSALLYGGTLTATTRHVVGQYKTGPKVGQDRYRIDNMQYLLPRRIDPPRGSALKKEGFYSTNEETLRSVKCGKEERKIVDKLLALSKLEKLQNTYYKGLRSLAEEKDWKPNYLYGQFNQCIARTGRLSSSAPNLQNFPGEVDQFLESRYD